MSVWSRDAAAKKQKLSFAHTDTPYEKHGHLTTAKKHTAAKMLSFGAC